MRRWLGWLLLASLVGCATYVGSQLDARFGPADPARFDQAPPVVADIDFTRDVKPILDSRCVVCHGCYDAPCQLKLTAYQGVTRGASTALVYDSARLLAAEPTRLFVDAERNAQWRDKNFHPVLNERAPQPEANRVGGVMARLLALKQAHGLPEGPLLPQRDFDLRLDRKQQCPRAEEMDRFEERHPLWGMPYGLPAVSGRDHATLMRWLEAGAPDRGPAPLAAGHAARVADWERFLNGDSLKARLMSRYIFEHWFAAHLYFDDLPAGEYFELVRSTTPPGQAIRVIATRRPYDDPGVERVYYRLRRLQETVLAKTHLPYALNPARMARIRGWFIDAPYPVRTLPAYAPAQASNPFVTFRELPVEARYRFMLEDAKFTMDGFMKGPVCRGQIALNVINDHFWVLFADPALARGVDESEALAASLQRIHLPAEQDSTTRLLAFRQYAEVEESYLSAKSALFNQRFGARSPLTLDALWKGDGHNPGAALTAFRHFDSASVIQGLHGERPQTVLLLGYPLFERIHYLLVAGFDVFGNAGHQLATRMYMDFLRMEGELDFLALLPRAARQRVHDHWYRGASPSHVQHLASIDTYFAQESGIRYRSDDPLGELYGLLEQRYAPLARPQHAVSASGLPAAALAALRQLDGVRGTAASLMPEVAFVQVHSADGREHPLTVLRHSAHLNVATPLGDDKTRVPAEDRLQVLNGFVGAYPDAFYRVDAAALPQFARQVAALADEAGYAALMTRFGIRRTDPRFWATSDTAHAAYRAWAPREAGLFDYARLDNR